MKTQQTLESSVDALEKKLISDALKKHPSIGAAASSLGLKRTTLAYKISRLKIDTKKLLTRKGAQA